MSEFNIKIAVDPSNAKATIDGVASSLDKAETGAKNFGIAAASGMKEGSVSADRAARAIMQVDDAYGLLDMATKAQRNSFASLNDTVSKLVNNPLSEVLKAEREMLESIRAPLADYESGIAAVDSLLRKNEITTDEWISKVSQLNRELERVHPPDAMKMAPPPDGSPTALGGALGVGVSVGAAAGALKSIDSLSNGMIDAQNAALKYADASMNVTQVISKERDMAVAMHSTYEETAALYDKVWTAGRNLHLTNNQLADSTEALGIIAKMSNQPLDAAEGILKRLTLAADTGTLSQRTMQMAFKEMPALADALTKAYGKNEKQLIDMAVAGNVNVRDMFLKLGKQLPELEQSFTHFAEKSDESMRGLAFSLAGVVDGTHDFMGLAAGEKAATEAAAQMMKEHDRAAKVLEDLRKSVELVKMALAGWKPPRLSLDQFMDWGTGQPEVLKKLEEEFKKSAAKAKAMWEHVFDGATEGARKFQSEMAIVNSMVTGKVLTPNQGAIELEKLVAGFAGGDVVKMIDQIRGTSMAAEAEFLANEARAKLLLKDKILDTDTYRQLLVKIAELHDASTIPRSVVSLGATGATGSDPHELDSALGNATTNANAAAVQGAIEKAMAASRNETARYQEEVLKFDQSLKGLTIDGAAHEKVLQSIRQRYDDSRDPIALYNEKVREAKDLYTAIQAPAEDLERKLRSLREQFGQSTFTDGLADGFAKIRKEVGGLSNDVSTTLTNAFNGLNDKMADMITTGKADWGALASQIERDLVKTGLHNLEKSAMDALSPAASQAAGTAASAAAIGTAMTAAGVGVGADLVASITAGAIELSAEFIAAGAAVAAEISAAMTISSVVPHLASGGAFTPTGTDTVPFMAMVSPGERIIVQTPAQQRQAAQQNSGGTVTNHYHYHDHGDPRGLAPLQQEMANLKAMVMKSRGARR